MFYGVADAYNSSLPSGYSTNVRDSGTHLVESVLGKFEHNFNASESNSAIFGITNCLCVKRTTEHC